jgi:hypothetical protein
MRGALIESDGVRLAGRRYFVVRSELSTAVEECPTGHHTSVLLNAPEAPRQ